MAVGCLDQDGDALARFGRLDREMERRAGPGAEHGQRLDAVRVVEHAAGILAGADLGRTMLSETRQQHLARANARADGHRAPVGGEIYRGPRCRLRLAYRREDLFAMRADHLAGALDDDLRGVALTAAEPSGIGFLPVGRSRVRQRVLPAEI